jgi:hypothetical protein
VHRQAIAGLKQVLAIEPEDLQAHYNLMLCHQGAGEGEMAKRHEALHRRFQVVHEHGSVSGGGFACGGRP